MSRPGLESGPPAWEANTLEKNHLDSLYASYSEPLLMMRLASFIQTSTVSILNTFPLGQWFFMRKAENWDLANGHSKFIWFGKQKEK
jgi:hypothetical protein